jgi:hypothetical protein
MNCRSGGDGIPSHGRDQGCKAKEKINKVKIKIKIKIKQT